MVKKKFNLNAQVGSNNLSAIKPVLERLIGKTGTLKLINDSFEIKAELEGESSRDLNRMLLSEMRKVEKKTRLRAEWTADGVSDKFFDYALKATRKEMQT